MKTCEVCKETAAKYRCPRCDVETCCLTCVNQHKVKNNCTGQRDKTAYVKVSEYNDRNLLNDYRFLEDAGRKNNNAARDLLKRRHNKPNFLRELEKQAGNRHIDLRLMPYPMSRRKNNSTNYQNRLKKMFWQIEWIFPLVDVTLIDKRICEDDTLESVLEKHVGVDSDPVVRHKLKPYITAGREHLSLYMKHENTEADHTQFYKLELTKSLLENFKHKQIVEYPSIHVVLPSQDSQYLTVPLTVESKGSKEGKDLNESNTSSNEPTDLNESSTYANEPTERGLDCNNMKHLEHVQDKLVESVT